MNSIIKKTFFLLLFRNVDSSCLIISSIVQISPVINQIDQIFFLLVWQPFIYYRMTLLRFFFKHIVFVSLVLKIFLAIARTPQVVALHHSALFNRFLPRWIMSFQSELLFISIHFLFLWRFSQAHAGQREMSCSIPLFSLLGYVWEQVGQQIGFRYNVITIDLPLTKEADQ